MIFDNFSRYDLKSWRLSARRWHDLIDHHGCLFDTVYISSRSKDINVLEGITRSETLGKKIRHVVFDGAHFIKRNMECYFIDLSEQLHFLADFEREHRNGPKHYYPKHSANPDFQHLRGLIRSIKGEPEAFKRCRRDSVFLKGFNEYQDLVKEQDDLLDEAWFTGVCHALQRIDCLESVIIRDTWDMLFSPGRTLVRDIKVEEEDLYSTLEVWHKGCGDINEGRSPTARSWSPTTLLPMGRTYPWDDLDITERHHRMLSDGSVEILKMFEALEAAGKRPSEISLPKGINGSGVPPKVFSNDSHIFRTVCGRLHKLDLQLAGGTMEVLRGLHCLLENTPTLQQLSLTNRDVQSYSEIFPGRDWRHPTLRKIQITGLEVSYGDLAALLFKNFPQSEYLHMSVVRIVEGSWEGLSEGLCHCRRVRDYRVNAPPLNFRSTWYGDIHVE